MATRLLDQNPVYFDDEGIACAGGTLEFCESGTTTPLNVYSTPALSVSLGASVDLDASGRPESDIWLAVDSYRVILKDADGVTVWTRDYTGDIAEAGAEPLDPATGNEDDVYSTDGTTASWRAISEVPSQTGHSGKYLTTDGEVASWGAVSIPEYDADSLPGGIEQTTTTFRIGNLLIQMGSGTVPTAAAIKSSVGVTFASAFDSTPVYVGLTANAAGVTGESAHVSMQATSLSTTGFTAHAFAGAEDGGGNLNITSSVPFQYIAIGIKAPA